MNETEKSLWAVMKQHWLTLGGGLFVMFSIYTNDANQTKQLATIDARVSVLEQARAADDTRWAVLGVKLDTIQNDLTDIKTQIKKENK